MACATLKRNYTFDLLDSTSAKKRKFHADCSQTFASKMATPASPFVPSEATTQAQLKRRIKEEIKRLQRRRLIPRFLGGPAPTVPTTFTSHIQEDSKAVVSCSLRSLALRSPQRDGQDSDSDQSPQRPSEASFRNFGTSDNATPLSIPQSVTSLQTNRPLDSVPIFTLPQVTSLCDRLIKEREEQLREEYDNILSCKLAEQYEAFLKFNHDQLYNRFHTAPMSYVS